MREDEYAYQLQRGTIAINLDQHDGLVDAQLTDGGCDVMLFASNGRALRRERGACDGPLGHRCTRHEAGTGRGSVRSCSTPGDILTATENGYGKPTPASEYPRKGRGTQGVILMRLGDGESLQAVECVDALVESEEGEIADPTAAIEPPAQS